MDVSDLVKAVPQVAGDGPFPQAPKFEVIGTPASLLNVALPASATLYTRRGTLVGVNGALENVTSTLSVLKPTLRAAVGIPFLYQRITSTTPLTALITAKSSASATQTTFAVLTLDGRVDWTLGQRSALLAWAGTTITLTPKLTPNLSLARWGNTVVSGRGEVAVVGKGQIYQVSLTDKDDEFVVHPANVLAYTSGVPGQKKPAPYRLKHLRFRLQIPGFLKFFSKPSIITPSATPSPATSPSLATEIAHTPLARFLARRWASIAGALRTLVFGDDLFIRFSGPATVLIQSRAPRLADVIPAAEVRELRELARVQSPAFAPVDGKVVEEDGEATLEHTTEGPTSNGGYLKVAVVQDGKVTFRSVDNFKEFLK
ncbi:mitochondrial biogenesis AIM24-domain-containing protein [Limtongia smithiae]|uniref:mitochondrial biogenesis AIM24-domain-containing protein n=1 Tax=Limtongia smithiae TaxID=1125753 RepID=UPI0034CEC995